MKPGTVSTGRLINALRQLGFDYVFDTNFGADLTVMEEGAELLERLRSETNLPLFTSCCPGWVNWVEINRPDLLSHLSTTKSPQQMHGALTDAWREQFVAIEVMACVGGCLGGGGEPRSMDAAILQKRMHAIYEMDRRDAAGAASLFHPDGVWSTSSAFGVIRSAEDIEAVIRTRLPPRRYGPAYVRHRMESSTAVDDLIVVAPGGQRCRFSLETDVLRDGNRSRVVIRRLAREVLA
jgi:hypothetical protein